MKDKLQKAVQVQIVKDVKESNQKTKRPSLTANELASICDILKRESPDLCHHLRRVVRQPPTKIKHRSARGPLYDVEMRREDGEAILSVLRSTAEKYGRDFRVHDRSVGLLISMWSNVVQLLKTDS